MPGLYDYSDPRDNDWNYAKTTSVFDSPRNAHRYSDRWHTAVHRMVSITPGDNWTSNQSPAPGTSNGNLNAADGRLNAQIGFPDRNGGGSGS